MNIFNKHVVKLYQTQMLQKCNKRFCSSSTANVVYFGCYPSEKNVQYPKQNYDVYYPLTNYVYYPTNIYEYYHTANFTHYPSKFFTHHSNNGFIFF